MPDIDDVLRQADALAFVGVDHTTGQHHVGHSRDADQARDSRRAAAADEQAALAFGQRVVGAAFGDADVRRTRELEPAADDGAVQHRDHRDAAELDLLERRMPSARMHQAVGDAALGELRQIETCAEVLAFAAEHDHVHRVRQVDEGGVQLGDQRIVERVALGRAIEADVTHGALNVECEQRGSGDHRIPAGQNSFDV